MAKIITTRYKADIVLLPRVVDPEEVRTPDYLINGIKYEVKSPEGSGKSTIVDIIKKGKGQANKFILDLDLCGVDDDDAERQITKIFWYDKTLFVDTLVVFKNNDIVKVLERNK